MPRPPSETCFVRHLMRHQAPQVFNPWRDADVLDLAGHAAAERRRRLKAHFDCRPDLLLIGEASGYQGCHFSGVPFTSERLLLAGAIPRIDCRERIAGRVRPWSEPSATTVWGTLHALGMAERAVLWNAFPWHPHRADQPYSNRRPSGDEIRQGTPSLTFVLNRFEGATIVAVGQIARAALRQVLGCEPLTVRHPSMAGARQFRAQLAAIVRRGLRGRTRQY